MLLEDLTGFIDELDDARFGAFAGYVEGVVEILLVEGETSCGNDVQRIVRGINGLDFVALQEVRGASGEESSEVYGENK